MRKIRSESRQLLNKKKILIFGKNSTLAKDLLKILNKKYFDIELIGRKNINFLSSNLEKKIEFFIKKHNPDIILNFIGKKFSNAIIILDIHGESTSEKMALAHFFDGRVTAVVGTHTHIPTADQHLLEKGTFYQTDLGMCGDYDSVIGMKKSISIQKFTNKFLKSRLETASGDGTLCGVLIEINNKTKIVSGFNQIIIGGKLNPN